MAALKILSLVFCSFIKVHLFLDFFLFICLGFLEFLKVMYWCLSSIRKCLPLIPLNSASDTFCLPPYLETLVKHILNFIIVSFYTPYCLIISPDSCPLPPCAGGRDCIGVLGRGSSSPVDSQKAAVNQDCQGVVGDQKTGLWSSLW